MTRKRIIKNEPPPEFFRIAQKIKDAGNSWSNALSLAKKSKEWREYKFDGDALSRNYLEWRENATRRVNGGAGLSVRRKGTTGKKKSSW